jgi:hypothetical protein
MNKLIAAALMAATLLVAGIAQARMIESGIYYNASEPGRGFSIEQQGGQMTLIFYVYESSGEPIWYYASAAYSLNATGYPTLSTTLNRHTGGQCLGCTYRAPTGTAAVGPVTVQFSSPTAATLTVGAGPFGAGVTSIAISRFGFTDAVNPLLGQWAWAFSVGSTPTFSNTYGGFVRFTTVGSPVNSGGTGFVSGSPSGYGAECYTSGSLAGYCLMIYAGSSSYSETYLFPTPINELTGSWSLGSSTTSYRLKGLRVGMPGETTLFGTGTLPDAALAAASDDGADAAAETAKIAAVERAAGLSTGIHLAADAGAVQAASAALAARLREQAPSRP